MAIRKGSTKVLNAQEMLAAIEKRAFEIYMDRIKNDRFGDETTDWYEAEKEVKSTHQQA